MNSFNWFHYIFPETAWKNCSANIVESSIIDFTTLIEFVFGFVSGSRRWRDGLLTSGWLALAFLHRNWFGCRKDYLRKNLGHSSRGHHKVIQYLHGSFRTFSSSRYLLGGLWHARIICGCTWTAGWLFYRAHVHRDVSMHGPWKDVSSLGSSVDDHVVFYVGWCPSSR